LIVFTPILLSSSGFHPQTTPPPSCALMSSKMPSFYGETYRLSDLISAILSLVSCAAHLPYCFSGMPTISDPWTKASPQWSALLDHLKRAFPTILLKSVLSLLPFFLSSPAPPPPALSSSGPYCQLKCLFYTCILLCILLPVSFAGM
jgi:hypothetical protein